MSYLSNSPFLRPISKQAPPSARPSLHCPLFTFCCCSAVAVISALRSVDARLRDSSCLFHATSYRFHCRVCCRARPPPTRLNLATCLSRFEPREGWKEGGGRQSRSVVSFDPHSRVRSPYLYLFFLSLPFPTHSAQ